MELQEKTARRAGKGPQRASEILKRSLEMGEKVPPEPLQIYIVRLRLYIEPL